MKKLRNDDTQDDAHQFGNANTQILNKTVLLINKAGLYNKTEMYRGELMFKWYLAIKSIYKHKISNIMPGSIFTHLMCKLKHESK